VSASYHQDDEVVGKALDARLLRRLWTYVRPHAGWLLFSTVALAVVSALDLLPVWILGRVVDGPVTDRVSGVIGDEAFAASIAGWIALFAALLVSAFVLRSIQMWALNRGGLRAMLDLRTAIFRHVQSQPLAFYDRNPVGRLVTRVVHDVESLTEVLTSGVDAIFHDLLKLGIIVVWLLTLNWRLALVTFIVLPPMFWIADRFRRGNMTSFREVRGKISALNAYLQEAVTGARVIQLFAQEPRAAAGFRRHAVSLMDGHLKTVFNYSYFFPSVDFLGACAKALLLWYGAVQIAAGHLTTGDWLMFFFFLDYFFEPIRDVSEKYNLLQSAMASCERIFKVLDTKVDMPMPAHPTPLPEPARGEVEFDGVTFGYDPARPVLKGVSFRVKPGEKVAIVGATGGGKTTIISLLTRMYDVGEGAVRVDGVDVREADPTALRRRVAVVLQDVFLFAGDVEGNITLGDPAVTKERVVSAAKAVHADTFIDRLPEGYATRVQERGATLSVGQKQLLSFARALARDPAVLVLDEATSSVDSTTEALVQDAVEKLLRGRTAIVVAHRLSTIRSCDRILVMHHGELREEGTHRELLAKGGLYARLYQLQFAAQERAARHPGTPEFAGGAAAPAGNIGD
jgi:ATP-binding cassette, subfamily B, multidrug efflux pump